MKCYEHNEIDAVGICKLCHKALCKECSVLSDVGLTCKSKCSVNKVNYQIKVLSSLSNTIIPHVFTYAIAGILVLIVGIYFIEVLLENSSEVKLYHIGLCFLVCLLGIAFIVGAIGFIRSSYIMKKYSRKI